MTSGDAAARLIAAMRDQKVKEVAETLEGQDAARALAACTAISDAMRDLRATMRSALEGAGVSAVPIEGPEDHDALQFHATAIRVAPDNLIKAVATLTDHGFRTAIPLNAGQIRLLARSSNRLRMVRFDAASVRIDLVFSDRVPSVFAPSMADLGAVSLPSGLAPLYRLVRPIRIVLDRLTGPKARVSENDLLGTPESLIPDLMAQLDLTEKDVVMDLGCGDGRVVAAAAALGVNAIGYEIDPTLAETARHRCAALPAHSGRAEIISSPAEGADLSKATVIFLFVPTYLGTRLLQHIHQHAAPGTRIIAHEQTHPQWDPPAMREMPVISVDAMTVLHVWQVR